MKPAEKKPKPKGKAKSKPAHKPKGKRPSPPKVQEELEEPKERKDELDDLREKFDKAKAELRDAAEAREEAEAEKQRLSSQVADLKHQVQDLKEKNQELTEEKEMWDELIEEKELTTAEEIEKLRTELRDAERREQHLNHTVEQLNQKISEYEAQKLRDEQSPSAPEEIAATKSRFYIDLYPGQGGFQGKIVHTLTQDKRVLKDLNGSEIVGFISGHLPQMPANGEQEKQSQAQVSASAESDVQDSKRVQGPAMRPTFAAPRLVDFRTILTETGTASPVVRHDQPYRVVVSFDVSALNLPEDTPVNHNVTVFARQLGGGGRHVIGATQGVSKPSHLQSFEIEGAPLNPGQYRLAADVTFKLPHDNTHPEAEFIEGGVIRVV